MIQHYHPILVHQILVMCFDLSADLFRCNDRDCQQPDDRCVRAVWGRTFFWGLAERFWMLLALLNIRIVKTIHEPGITSDPGISWWTLSLVLGLLICKLCIWNYPLLPDHRVTWLTRGVVLNGTSAFFPNQTPMSLQSLQICSSCNCYS